MFSYIQDISSANPRWEESICSPPPFLVPNFVHFPFLHFIYLKLDYFLFAEKSRSTASNIPQMIRSGFLTLHLTTLDERRRK